MNIWFREKMNSLLVPKKNKNKNRKEQKKRTDAININKLTKVGIPLL